MTTDKELAYDALQDIINQRDNALEDIMTKADRLAEALIMISATTDFGMTHNNKTMSQEIAEQALKDYRGEK